MTDMADLFAPAERGAADADAAHAETVQRYIWLTREFLPDLARGARSDWPVSADHCFQRIVLDAVCGGVWYDHITRPAYRNLSIDQARRAVDLCEAIADGRADLGDLNRQSLAWRGKLRAP